MLSCAAIRPRLVALSSQLAMKHDTSSRRSTISGCFSKTSRATDSVFLLQTARITPRRQSSLA